MRRSSGRSQVRANDCNPSIAQYSQGKCGSTLAYNGKLYSCTSQAVGVNGEPAGCGTAGVYCSNMPPDYPYWGPLAWRLVQSCPP